jgi:hypothetical protein
MEPAYLAQDDLLIWKMEGKIYDILKVMPNNILERLRKVILR